MDLRELALRLALEGNAGCSGRDIVNVAETYLAFLTGPVDGVVCSDEHGQWVIPFEMTLDDAKNLGLAKPYPTLPG